LEERARSKFGEALDRGEGYPRARLAKERRAKELEAKRREVEEVATRDVRMSRREVEAEREEASCALEEFEFRMLRLRRAMGAEE
jgi:hypothetical protein